MQNWSFARFNLRLTDAEFYSLTPRQFDALCKRQRNKTAMDEFMLAQLTALVANTGFRSFEEPKLPKDFMPSEWPKTKSSEKKFASSNMSDDEKKAATVKMFRVLFINHGVLNG